MSMRYQAGIVLPGYNALKVANAPTIGTATAGASQVSVAFTAPSCVGGGAISSYTAYCTTTGTKTATGASSPLVVTGLTNGTAYTFKVVATNAYGPSYPSAASNSATPIAAGQQAYTTAGTYSWVAPSCVTSVSIVAVGAGGNGANQGYYVCSGFFKGGGGGGGGGLAYLNNYSVTPGNSYTVNVVAAGAGNAYSYFVASCVVGGRAGYNGCTGGNGGGGGTGGNGSGATSTQFFGGNGGTGTSACCGSVANGGGGGGAAGYAGNGGRGGRNRGSGCAAGVAGSGGAGGGGGVGANGSDETGGGGGVGLLGQGSSGAGGSGGARQGYGGSGGGGNCGGSSSAQGGSYGGGGAGKQSVLGTGGGGAVRIIWPGNTRQFPSTNTGNV